MWKTTKKILAETCVTAVKPLVNSAAELREKQCMKLMWLEFHTIDQALYLEQKYI